MDVKRNDCFFSQTEEDDTSLESYESFDEAYDRITKNAQKEKDIVSKDQATIVYEGKKAHIKTGPVFNITEEALQKGGGLHNVFNYNLRFNLCPITISKILIMAICLIVCATVPTLVVTLYEQPPSPTVPIDITSSPAVCTG